MPPWKLTYPLKNSCLGSMNFPLKMVLFAGLPFVQCSGVWSVVITAVHHRWRTPLSMWSIQMMTILFLPSAVFLAALWSKGGWPPEGMGTQIGKNWAAQRLVGVVEWLERWAHSLNVLISGESRLFFFSGKPRWEVCPWRFLASEKH